MHVFMPTQIDVSYDLLAVLRGLLADAPLAGDGSGSLGGLAIAGQLLSFLTWATDLSETVLSKSMSGYYYKKL